MLSVQVMRDESNASVIKKFAEEGERILGADAGFALEISSRTDNLETVYASQDMSLDPSIPKKKIGQPSIEKRRNILFDSDVQDEQYGSGISGHFKSYLIIPIRYGEHVFGSIVLWYKDRHTFTEEEFVLAETIRNMVSHAVNTNWLIEKEQKFLEMAEQQKSIEELLSQERSKTEFIANATHELRTPLAIMKGTIELALIDKDNVAVPRKVLSDVNGEIDILTNIIKDLSLITSPNYAIGQVLRPTSVNVEDLIGTLVARTQAIALQKNIQIRIKKGGGTFLIAGDEEYLIRLFLNLIKNSITYGKKDGHTFVELSKEKNMVKITITDDGIGISKEDLPKIFDRFYRGDKAHTRGAYGNHSGLGLSIAKWIAEAHGGKVTATSELGTGSIFTVVLPIE